MKKRFLILTLCLSMGAAMTACGSKETASSSAAGNSVTSASAADVEVAASSAADAASASASTSAEEDVILSPAIVEGDFSVSDCITLGDYKGLQLTRSEQEVTDTDVDNQISQGLTPTEVEDENATAELGDTVDIAYVGKLDGEAFDGGTSDSYDLVLGSGSFIDGFEDGVVGMKKGETKDLELTFPTDYHAEDLAGKAVVFTVTVNAIKRTPELTDDWVKEYTSGQFANVEDYKASVKESLEKQYKQTADLNLQQSAWSQVNELAEYKQLPQQYVDKGAEEFEKEITAQAEYYGLSLEEYVEQSGSTMDEFNEYKEQQGRYSAAGYLLLDAVIEAEQIADSGEEYDAQLQALADRYEMTTDDLLSTYGEDDVHRYVMTVLCANKIISYSDVTEA